jgi:6-phosphogluconolactonase
MAPDNTQRVVLPNPAAVAQHAAGLISVAAQTAVADHGRFTLALSGGSTPRELFRLLAGPAWRDRIPWSATDIFWADERCVPPDHPDSNYRVAQTELLAPLGIPHGQTHRLRGEDEPEVAAQAAERDLRDALGPAGRLDCILLGMGTDGHTASIFPGTEALGEQTRWVVPNLVPRLEAWRLTMTLPAINRARIIIFLVCGRDKADALHSVSSRGELPAARVRPTDGELIWLLDAPAATRRPPAS